MSSQCMVPPNPDITGTGIRVSVYVLALAGLVFSAIFRSNELANSIRSSLGMTGLGLFLTGVIATFKRSITLFHAICLFHLLCIVGISLSPKAHHSRGRISSHTFRTLQLLTICGFLAWDIHLFATAPTYGSQPYCNGSVKYVIFGVNVPATSPIFRWILVATFGALLIPAIFVVIGSFWCADVLVSELGGDDDVEITPWYRLIGHLMGRSYIIVMIELMIKRNKVSREENEWTFGQVLAMVMLVGPLIELVSLLLERVEVKDDHSPQPPHENGDNV